MGKEIPLPSHPKKKSNQTLMLPATAGCFFDKFPARKKKFEF